MVDKVIIHPPTTDGEPQDVELIGDLPGLFRAASDAESQAAEKSAKSESVLTLFVSSAKTGQGAKTLAAHSALMDQIHNFVDMPWQEEASPEERGVMDTLQHVLDGVAA